MTTKMGERRVLDDAPVLKRPCEAPLKNYCTHLLMVRKSDFHSGNRGSIPRGCSKFNWSGPIMVLEQIANLSAGLIRLLGSSPSHSANKGRRDCMGGHLPVTQDIQRGSLPLSVAKFYMGCKCCWGHTRFAFW